MGRIVVLDAGPLGLATRPAGKPDADGCRTWVRALAAAGVRVVVPEVADYEVRRELLRVGATTGIRRLDQLGAVVDYVPLATAVLRRAAALWAATRNAGLPTAHPHALDADCILAAQALLVGRAGDVVTVATTNARHITRFPGVDARPWERIPT